eukprot:376992-Amphidinium_carterae.1
MCARCGETVKDFALIVHHCSAWQAARSEAELPASALDAPPCVCLHGLLTAPPPQLLSVHEPALVARLGGVTVWTGGSGRHSMFGCPGLKQERLAVVRVLQECRPVEVVNDCKGAVACLSGYMQPKRRHRDLEERPWLRCRLRVSFVWMKAHQTDNDVEEGHVHTLDLQGNPVLNV